MSDTKSIIPKDSSEIAISVARTSAQDQWDKFRLEKSKGGVFMQFDSYRTSLGNRVLWGTKVFFKAMKDINFLQNCPEDSNSNGKYCPSEHAQITYPNLFKYDEVSGWGLSEQDLDEFDEKILPTLSRVAVVVKHQYDEANKRKAKARYEAKKALEFGEKTIKGETI